METKTKEAALQNLWSEIRELSLGTSPQIPHLSSPPTPLQFHRDFISQNKPCIISNVTHHWPSLTLWKNPSYLTQTLSTTTVSLHLTPTGLADSLAPHPHPNSQTSMCFASAHVEKLPFPKALEQISCSKRSVMVAYAQEQNDCFRKEYKGLANDVDDEIPWASEALGCSPEAVNLWIGNQCSVTSFHKDHYENLYAVVTGEKRFLLLPPTDVHRLYVKSYPAAQYCFDKETGEFTLELEKPLRYVPWCSVNPYPPAETRDQEMLRFPLYFNGPKPFECTVKAGEILYLPSMWFHHVSQSPDNRGHTISINYWYDMQFDIKYAYFNFLQSIEICSSLDSNNLVNDNEDSVSDESE